GGIARSYYIALSASSPAGQGPAAEPPLQEDPGSPSALPDARASLLVLCVVPQHLEEGQDVVLEKPELELALGQPVVFPLYTSTVRSDDKPGDVLTVAPEQLLQLPPL